MDICLNQFISRALISFMLANTGIPIGVRCQQHAGLWPEMDCMEQQRESALAATRVPAGVFIIIIITIILHITRNQRRQ
ncbi:hypothetical protein TEQG_08719 [Trichophyton equinum CBS 127.97]|uniref:Uncharacterized protein n=1 Tax=Trichophyton equinum (strain ATCC MYA-4606 / CBS 127.97) TaxID=559882 RepID=F2PVU0_TRIEC|nr:hypothetical protein TEQG_08719 [Trichophyton equinum CBS 127.97]